MAIKYFKSAILSIILLISVCFCPNCTNIKQTKATESISQININAKSAYLIDYNTGTEIISKNATEKLPIASMTKLATLAIIFNEIDSGLLSETDMISVSQTAANTEGSSAFLDYGSKYSVTDLIKTIVMVSANDSCVALAEHISGSEELFAKKMNTLKDKLNLENSNFENSTGLPSKNHYSCAKDLAKIYQSVCENEIYKKYSKIWMEDFVHPSGRVTGLVNTNRLIKTYDGCDSGKTGHTEEAKYCLTASATRGGTRLISVVIGAPDSKTRFEQTKEMFNYGFANFTSKVIVSTDMPMSEVQVVGSSQKTIHAYAKENYTRFCSKDDTSQYKTHVVLNDKIKAPLKIGDKVGTLLVLDQNNIVMKEIDLIAQENVEAIKFGEILDNIFKAW